MDTTKKLALAALLLALFPSLQARADDDDDDDDDEGEGRVFESWGQRGEGGERGEGGGSMRGGGLPGVAAVSDATYQSECGSCHMAYPPGLLPARSWVQILGGLDDHYGDVASLPPETIQTLARYLVPNAADTRPDHRLSARIAASVAPDQVPLRILDVPWLRHEHGEIPDRWVQANTEVRSLSRCEACHTGAATGSFREGEVRIPGAGRWGD